MNSFKILNNLISLKNEWQNSQIISEKDRELRINMVNTFIRSHELILRLNDYKENGYYFGYLLIQSQRIEETIRTILTQLENYRAKKESRSVIQINMDIPMGALIDKLKHYIESDLLFFELSEFKKLRDKIVHKLNKDFSVSLLKIENLIHQEYHPEKINHLQALLLSTTISLDPKTFGNIAQKNIMKEYGLENIDIKIK